MTKTLVSLLLMVTMLPAFGSSSRPRASHDPAMRVRTAMQTAIPLLGLSYGLVVLTAPTVTRDEKGIVFIKPPEGCQARYTIDGSEPSEESMLYETPFPLVVGGTVRALTIVPEGEDVSAAGRPIEATVEFDALPISTAPADNAAWTAFDPALPDEAVEAVSDTLPLSDQADAAGWTPFEPMWDEFDGESLDEDKWLPRNPDWKGRQPALFASSNVEVRDGGLHLTMRAEEPDDMPKDEGYHTFTSAAVQNTTVTRYGYFEVKARAMRSGGSSAFWFYNSKPAWWTEIDVFEVGGGAPGFERKLNMACHFFHATDAKEHWAVGGVFEAPFDLADDFHVYGLEWDADQIRYYLDGALVRSGPNTHWHQPLTLNFDSETMPDWFGLPNVEDLPSTFSIEYIRAWKREP